MKSCSRVERYIGSSLYQKENLRKIYAIQHLGCTCMHVVIETLDKHLFMKQPPVWAHLSLLQLASIPEA